MTVLPRAFNKGLVKFAEAMKNELGSSALCISVLSTTLQLSP